MTEAGEKWVNQIAEEEGLPDPIDWHALSRRAAEFWLRAFCEAVEQRALVIFKDDGKSSSESIYRAFSFVKRELLGDKW